MEWPQGAWEPSCTLPRSSGTRDFAGGVAGSHGTAGGLISPLSGPSSTIDPRRHSAYLRPLDELPPGIPPQHYSPTSNPSDLLIENQPPPPPAPTSASQHRIHSHQPHHHNIIHHQFHQQFSKYQQGSPQSTGSVAITTSITSPSSQHESSV